MIGRDNIVEFLSNKIYLFGPLILYGGEIKSKDELEKLSDGDLRAVWRDELQSAAMQIEGSVRFASPAYDADYEFWARKPNWNIEEFAILAAGKDPFRVNEKDLNEIAFTTEMGKSFFEARDLMTRLLGLGKLKCPASPASFVAHARDYRLELPKEMVLSVELASGRALGLEAENDLLKAEIKKIKTSPEYLNRERQSINMIIAGMAIGGYSLNLKGRDGIIVDIKNDIERSLGINRDTLTVDTVRKYVVLALDELGIEHNRKSNRK